MMFKRFWYDEPTLLNYFLLPFSWIYRVIIFLRRLILLKKQVKFKVPIIVVGNITVGGTGKTPLVIWLANFLKAQGYKPGIVSRGYGGKASHYPQAVNAQSDPKMTGDEPLLISLHTACPVIIDPDRVNAVNYLLKNYDCDCVISDDGLQHYRLGRTIEIVVVDGERQFGNQLCLPAGPLREPISRANSADFIVINGERADDGQYHMTLVPELFCNIISPDLKADFDHFLGRPVHAAAGIGNPDRFFNLLKSKGLSILPHPFPDHYLFTEKDFDFDRENPILMTEKDAVKCKSFADYRYWYLPVKAEVDQKLGKHVLEKLSVLRNP